jgi:hypothetical protein
MLQVPTACVAEAIDKEFLMTFQVALVGTDAVAVGSDRLTSEYSPYDHADSHRTSHVSQVTADTKILLSADKSVLCAHAGTNTSREMAEAIAANGCLPHVSDQLWRATLKSLVTPISAIFPVPETVIVVRTATRSIFKVMREHCAAPAVTPIAKSVCTGDVSSSARFIGNHLLPAATSTNQLKNLALLAVIAAHKENPSAVGLGYDIAVVTDGTISLESFTETQGDAVWSRFMSNLMPAIEQCAT